MVYSGKSASVTVSQFTRKKILTETTNGTNVPTDYQSKLTITYESEMQSDFADIRFNTTSGVYIDYWIERYTASTSAIVWIKLPDAITDPGSYTILMYYGNAELSDGGIIKDTMIFGDEFNTDYTPVTETQTNIANNASRYESWPDIAILADGTLITAYRTCDSNTHTYDSSGRAVIKKSTDNGVTWGSEIVAINETSIDDRNVEILVFDDDGTETVILAYNTYDGVLNNCDVCVVKSTDGGDTWGSKIFVHDGLTWGSMAYLSNGKILLPYYRHSQDNYAIGVGESDDGGDTWTNYTVVANGTSQGNLTEWALVETKTAGEYTGGVYGIIRSNTENRLYKVISTDYGHTWSAATEETGLPMNRTSCAYLLRHSNGNILVNYSQTSQQVLYGSDDQCASWSFVKNLHANSGGIKYGAMVEETSSSLYVVWASNVSTSDVYGKTIRYGIEIPGWTQQTGAWTVVSGILHSPTSAGAYLRCNTPITEAPYIVTTKAMTTNNLRFITMVEANNPMVNSASLAGQISTGGNVFDLRRNWSWGPTSHVFDDDTFYITEIDVISNNNIMKVYDSNHNFLRTTSIRSNSSGINNYFGFYASSDDNEYDWIFVRKYIANEPTLSYGTASHQRKTPQIIG